MNGLSTLIKAQPVGGSGRAARLSQAGAASGTLPALGQACVGEYLFFGFLDVLREFCCTAVIFYRTWVESELEYAERPFF